MAEKACEHKDFLHLTGESPICPPSGEECFFLALF